VAVIGRRFAPQFLATLARLFGARHCRALYAANLPDSTDRTWPTADDDSGPPPASKDYKGIMVVKFM
jgi:hypothetical protein